MSNARVALLIDGENIKADLEPQIRAYAQKLGRLIVGKVFGDFSNPCLEPWKARCVASGLEPAMQLPGKNSADMAIAIDAMELLHRGKVDAFCIASSDRDFLPLVLRLKREDKIVHGAGGAKTSATLRAAYCHFLELPGDGKAPSPAHSKPQAAKTTVPEPANPKHPVAKADFPEQQLRKVFARVDASQSGGWMTLPAASEAIRTHNPELAKIVCGAGKFRKKIRETGLFEEKGTGPEIQIRLKAPLKPAAPGDPGRLA